MYQVETYLRLFLLIILGLGFQCQKHEKTKKQPNCGTKRGTLIGTTQNWWLIRSHLNLKSASNVNTYTYCFVVCFCFLYYNTKANQFVNVTYILHE